VTVAVRPPLDESRRIFEPLSTPDGPFHLTFVVTHQVASGQVASGACWNEKVRRDGLVWF